MFLWIFFPDLIGKQSLIERPFYCDVSSSGGLLVGWLRGNNFWLLTVHQQ